MKIDYLKLQKKDMLFIILSFQVEPSFFILNFFSFKSEHKKEIYWKKNLKDVNKLLSSLLKTLLIKKQSVTNVQKENTTQYQKSLNKNFCREN